MPKSFDVLRLMAELKKIMSSPGEARWNFCLIQIERSSTRLHLDFDYGDGSKWRVTPANLATQVEALRPAPALAEPVPAHEADAGDFAKPGRIIAASLRMRRWKLLRLFATALILASPSLFEHSLASLLCTAFFGVRAITLLILLLPGAAYLRLEPEGFTVCSLFRKHFTAWSDVSVFGAAMIGRKEMVVYNSRETAARRPRMAGLSASLSGYNSALPDTYGPRAAELAALLNAILRAARRAPAGPKAAETAQIVGRRARQVMQAGEGSA